MFALFAFPKGIIRKEPSGVVLIGILSICDLLLKSFMPFDNGFFLSDILKAMSQSSVLILQHADTLLQVDNLCGIYGDLAF